jgi:hypothetical protein
VLRSALLLLDMVRRLRLRRRLPREGIHLAVQQQRVETVQQAQAR